jgi:hypothetical protein
MVAMALRPSAPLIKFRRLNPGPGNRRRDDSGQVPGFGLRSHYFLLLAGLLAVELRQGAILTAHSQRDGGCQGPLRIG